MVTNSENDIPNETKIITDENSVESSEPFVNTKNETVGSDNLQTQDEKPSENKITKTDDSNNTDNNKIDDKDNKNNKEEVKLLTYKEYLSLSAEKREEYYKTFESVDAFAKWHKSALEEYKKDDDSIQITGNGSLNLEDYIK